MAGEPSPRPRQDPADDKIIDDLGPDGKGASGFGPVKCAGYEADVAHQIGPGIGGYSLSGLTPQTMTADARNGACGLPCARQADLKSADGSGV